MHVIVAQAPARSFTPCSYFLSFMPSLPALPQVKTGWREKVRKSPFNTEFPPELLVKQQIYHLAYKQKESMWPLVNDSIFFLSDSNTEHRSQFIWVCNRSAVKCSSGHSLNLPWSGTCCPGPLLALNAPKEHLCPSPVRREVSALPQWPGAMDRIPQL